MMMAQRKVRSILLAVLALQACPAAGQTGATNVVTGTNPPPAALADPSGKKWSFSASIYGYIVPDSLDYVQPTLTADRGLLHLEARYNYEALKTGSVWVGCNFGAGEKLQWELTPMLGGVFGDATGIAPGFRGLVRIWKLELYCEGEYFADIGDSSRNFFYNWAELTLSPAEWLRFGLVAQRTHVYRTERDLQRGFLVGLIFKHLEFTTYVFNPDESKPTIVLATAVHW
jgi:hypothetical protein